MNPFHQPTSEENMSAANKAGCQGVAMQLLGHSVLLPGCCYAVCSEYFITVALQLLGHSVWLAACFWIGSRMFQMVVRVLLCSW